MWTRTRASGGRQGRYRHAASLLIIAVISTTVSWGSAAATDEGSDEWTPPTLRDGCRVSGDAITEADLLLRNRYHLGAEPYVTLPADPTWAEDPFHDYNWLFNYHALRFVLTLEQAWAQTGSTEYLDRAMFLLRDWYIDNPRSNPPSPFSWNDHATAWRAMVLACTAEIVTPPTSLRAALDLHGATLASSSFYVRHGNHALNQAIGLLDVGAVRNRSDWKALAADRINTLVVESVTTSGVSIEQSIGYTYYNYARYSYARIRLRATGQPISSAFARVDKMPTFLGWASLPNGQYELIGDTQAHPLPAIRGTLAEFVATAGGSGPKPVSTTRIYGAGYAFGRTGWGENRPFEDEIAFSLKFGPPVRFHGHVDGGSLNMYGFGRRLIVGSGTYSYNPGPFRDYFVGRRSQNTVDVSGARYVRSGATSLLFQSRTPSAFAVSVRVRRYEGVSDMRTVAFSRRLGYLVVDDRLSASTSHTYTQMWHLFPGASLVKGDRSVRTTSTGGSVLIRQLALAPTISVVRGATNPIQGWRTLRYNSKVTAPAVLARRTGRSARFLTLIVPMPSPTTSVRVLYLRYSSKGFSLVVSVGGKRERMTLDGSTVSVRALN
jgi:hypothetical protein